VKVFNSSVNGPRITAPSGEINDSAKLIAYRRKMDEGCQALLIAHLIHGHWIHSPKALTEAFEAAGVPMAPFDAMPVGMVAKRLVERLQA